MSNRPKKVNKKKTVNASFLELYDNNLRVALYETLKQAGVAYIYIDQLMKLVDNKVKYDNVSYGAVSLAVVKWFNDGVSMEEVVKRIVLTEN